MNQELSGSYDIAIVGGGLSAAALIHSLSNLISGISIITRPIKIIVFDKTGNFWCGVPYGSLAEPDFFLIEDLNQTDCRLFREWIYKNIKNITQWMKNDSFMLKVWYTNNQRYIENNDLDRIFFPRYFFGIFISDLLRSEIRENASYIDVAFVKQEIIDSHIDKNSIILTSKTNDNFIADRMVLAIGSAPKLSSFAVSEDALNSKRYISDSDICAVFNLRDAIPICLSEAKGKQDVIIIGGGASALETVYFITTRPRILEKINCIKVISTSGTLIGGLNADDYDGSSLPPYVSLRTSSDIYINAARNLYNNGLLRVFKGKADNLVLTDNRFHLSALKTAPKKISTLSLVSDIVINCCGSGSLLNTSSMLLRNLVTQLPINKECRGFAVNTHNQAIGHDNVYILGPLLNSSFSGRQVESIKAVFRESEVVANHLIDQLHGINHWKHHVI